MPESIAEEDDKKCADEKSENNLIKNGESVNLSGSCRKEKRKFVKKLKRKQIRKENALKGLAEEEAKLNDPEEQSRIRLKEQEEADILERERKEFEERERLFIDAVRKAAEEADEKRRFNEDQEKHDIQAKLSFDQCLLVAESFRTNDRINLLVIISVSFGYLWQVQHANESDKDDDFEYVEEGPAEIIWQGNEIIVKKKRIKVPKKKVDQQLNYEDDNRPTSNPLPPQSVAFETYKTSSVISANAVFDSVAQQTPNFGTEQDKAHCPFHIKTGACRFGARCSRVHFYPDRSCTLLIKNMYNGPGLAWEQDEGLEYTDEEVDRCYEEFYEDVHTEFLKFGEMINFKVCRNGSFHLRGNVYVHYKSLESAVLAYNTINGRYFAGKQMTCEFVGVTRWKVAICGDYMKSRLKSCSHGTACNFIHCFRNPGGDYEWADWDSPPPKYWVKKMAALFGPSEELSSGKHHELEYMGHQKKSGRRKTTDWGRYRSRRSSSAELDHENSDSGGDGARRKRDSNRRTHRSDSEFSNENIRNQHGRRTRGKEHSGSQKSKKNVPLDEGKLKSEKLGSGDRKPHTGRSSSGEMDYRNCDPGGDFSDKNGGAHRHSSRMVAHYSGSEFSDENIKDQHDRHSRRKKHKRDFPVDKGKFKSEELASGERSSCSGESTGNRYAGRWNDKESDISESVQAKFWCSGYHSGDSLENSGNVQDEHHKRSGSGICSSDRSHRRNEEVECEIGELERIDRKSEKRESRKRLRSRSSGHRSGHKQNKHSDNKHKHYSGRSWRESERSP